VGRFPLLSFVHPTLFHFGRFVLPTYGLLLAVGTVLALLVSVRNARLLALDTEKIWTLALLAIVTMLVASKAMLLLLYWPQVGWRALGLSGFGRQDDLVAWVSALLAAVISVFYCRRHGLPVRRTADAIAPGVAVAGSIASIACLEAGCGYGTPTNLSWAVVFRSRGAVPGTPLGVPLHPTQMYASVAGFLILVVLMWLLHARHKDGEVLGAGLFLGGLTHAALAPLRGDPGLWIADRIPVAQLVSAVMILASAVLWLRRPQPLQEGLSG
jgi:phosphatidylglycerol---prolipoprotein diacylglyceryl transferase